MSSISFERCIFVEIFVLEMMNRSACFVCRKSAKCFAKNLWSLKTRHSEMPICAAIKVIINKAISSLDNSATVCYGCVEKINEYDKAKVKMQQIQRELNRTHENANSTCNGAVINDETDKDNDGIDGYVEDDSDSDYSNYSLVSLDKTLQMPKCSICKQSFERFVLSDSSDFSIEF